MPGAAGGRLRQFEEAQDQRLDKRTDRHLAAITLAGTLSRLDQ
ncbi:hypothetical protein ACFXBB_16450 [Streptomyces scopuliridis]